MVAHNGAAFLPRTLAALRDQTRLIDRFVGVDASSADESADLLRRHLPADDPFAPYADRLDSPHLATERLRNLTTEPEEERPERRS